MRDKKNRLVASLALTAGLAGGAAAGLVLGVPGVSGAQTTTVPAGPSTSVPDPGPTQPDAPVHDGKNCPNKDGTGTSGSGVAGAATNASAGFRGGGGARV